MAKKKTKKEPAQRPSRKKSGKKGGVLTVIAVALVTLIAGIIILTWFGAERFRLKKPVIIEKDVKEVSVYFSDSDGLYLKPERHRIKKGGVEAEAKEALAVLLEGPRGTSLERPVPEGTRLLSLMVKDGTATADFSAEIIKNHGGGSSGEIQTVYSIVDTLALNFPEIKSVRILVDGRREATIAGHIDITFPLGPDKKVIKE